MLARLIAVVGISITFAIVAFFVGVAFFSRGSDQVAVAVKPTDRTADGNREQARFSGQIGKWTVLGRLFDKTGGSFQIQLLVTDGNGSAALDGLPVSVRLDMLGHQMAPVAPMVRAVAPGTYWIDGAVPMAGPWRARITLPDGTVEVSLNIGS